MIFTPGTLGARLLIAATVTLLLAGLGAGGTYHLMAGKVAAVEAQRDTLARAVQEAQEQRKKDGALLARRAAANAVAARQAASLQAQLAATLAANRAWADVFVPKEVQDALGR